jgi:glycosyltransferase involved in cell wall biosynthesis
VKLVIVHYHLRPGGIRRVVELATPALVKQFGNIDAVTLACGEAPDQNWNQNFARLIQPARLEWLVAPAFGYFSEQSKPPAVIQAELAAALAQLLAGATATNCLVWAHNLGIGRNLLLTRELTHACAERGVPLISHHHDWWFDNRWPRWPEIRRSGFRSLAAVARTTFPTGPNIRQVGINHEEAALLKRHYLTAAAWLPNPAARQPPPAPKKVRAARQWLDQTLAEVAAPVWMVPCRLLRRKNLAEALLLTRWLRPEAWLVTTGGASSADEQAYFDQLTRAARQHHWRLRLGVLQGDEKQKPTVPELLAASEAVLLTSIQEGFGLPYVEAAAAGRPLIARNLPNVAPDLKKFGFRFPQAYDEIRIATGLFDWKAERARQRTMFARWRRILPPAARRLGAPPALLTSRTPPEAIPFSRLTLTAQLEVLAQPPADSWKRCAPLNPFLPIWQSRAAAGKLLVTPWPQTAAQLLSGETYARHFVRLARPHPVSGNGAHPLALQTALLGKKLCAANSYPLLWATET